MALNVQVGGVERRAYARYRTLRIHKEHAIETCRIEFIDLDSTASALRPALGAALRVDRDGTALQFGGEITRVEDQRIGQSDIGTVTVVEARGWYFEAEAIRIPLLVLPAQDAYVTIDALRATYLAAKGWTTAMAASGGTVLPALIYEQQTIAAIFNDLAERLQQPWRVNGDRVYAFVTIGSLTAPSSFTDSNAKVLRGSTWSQERVRSASRIFITTGGAGDYLPHVENHATNGVKTRFPVNVLPPVIPGRVNNAAGYSAGASSLALTGLPTSATVRSGSSLRFATHLGYATTAAAVVDGNGDAIVPISPVLSTAVVDGEVGIFGPEACVTFELNGVATALDGAPWAYDHAQAIIYTNSAAPSSVAGPATYRARINLPALVRTWTAAAQAASGAFDYGEVRDAVVAWPTVADVSEAKTQGDTELAYRAAEPKTLRLATYVQDVYPWQVATCTIASRLISGTWLVQSVTLTDTGRLAQNPRLEITLLEGSAIGRDWRTFWRTPSASAGGGGVGGTAIGGGVVSGGSSSGSTLARFPLGGDNYRGDNPTTWTDAPNATPLRFGGAATPGTWTLRAYRRVTSTTSPVTTVEVRLYDLTNAVTLATITGTSSTTFSAGTQSFTAPGTEGVVVLQYRCVVTSGTAAEARVGQCTLERD